MGGQDFSGKKKPIKTASYAEIDAACIDAACIITDWFKRQIMVNNVKGTGIVTRPQPRGLKRRLGLLGY